MMKKLIFLLFIFCITFCLVSCGSSELVDEISGVWNLTEESWHLTELECYSFFRGGSFIFFKNGTWMCGSYGSDDAEQNTYTITEESITIDSENWDSPYVYSYSITGRMLELQFEDEESLYLLGPGSGL